MKEILIGQDKMSIQDPPNSKTNKMWRPALVEDFPSLKKPQLTALLDDGWFFDSPLNRPAVVIEKLGNAKLCIRGSLISASACQVWVACEDPFLLVKAVGSANLQLTISFFDKKAEHIKGRLIRVDVLQGLCLIELNVSSNKHYLSALGLHVLYHRIEVAPQAILDRGARLPSLEPYFEYQTIKTRQEFDEVIDLRTKAYLEAGKLEDGSPMTDAFDEKAIILVGKLFGKIVASLRIMPHRPGEAWEHDRFLTWTPELPPKPESVEITRVCTDPAFKRTNVLLGLFQRTALLVLVCGRRYLIGCATQGLMPLYQRIGCIPSSVRFSHADLGNQQHTLFYADVQESLLGKTMNPVTWSLLWNDTSLLSCDSGLLTTSSISDSLRQHVLRAGAPLLQTGGKIALGLSRNLKKSQMRMSNKLLLNKSLVKPSLQSSAMPRSAGFRI